MSHTGERKLATIRRVSAIDPIPGADAIVKLTIDGWELVSGKENFQVGDLCVYFEIDSFLPVRPEFEFLRDRCFKSTTNLGDGFRLKTIKLRGQVSQGLALPLADFFQDGLDENKNPCYTWAIGEDYLDGPNRPPTVTVVPLKEGDDVTEYLGIQKYEKPEVSGPGANMGGAKGNWPDFLQKTDQERVQNCWNGIRNWILYDKPVTIEVADPEAVMSLEKYGTNLVIINEEHFFKSGDLWFHKKQVPNTSDVVLERSRFEATVKLDGSSMTVYHNEGRLGVCSRNLELTRNHDNVFWKVALESSVLLGMFSVGRNVAIQGELMGPGVQGNREKLEDHSMYIFDVYDIDAKRYMTPQERTDYLDELYAYIDPNQVCLQEVPNASIISINPDLTVADFLIEADQQRSINHEIGEGVVYKSCVPGGPSFKCIANRYLLKEKD